MAEQPSPESIFDAARKKSSPAERAAYLDSVCGGNDALRRRVERLLAGLEQAGSFLELAVAGTGEFEPSQTPNADVAGTIIAGRYKLIEAIGEGGMGTVWMAQQTEPVKRHVAVKLIKAGMDSKQVLARFEAERQALAVMDHPNIAKILDGGVSEKGTPFFVMELVKGVPITKYCDEHKLTPRQRLELFVPVCQAIQHAHQKGIIHRDIKPSNVMVAPYDDKPVPKVIDFGVAKAMGQSLTDQTLNTGFGGIAGTPEYMSPEQATLNNLDIDTRSDVYSLGVLLYELLAGSPPFKRKELEQAGVLEMLRLIREEEPPRPSTKLSTADALPSLSANRSTEPKKLTGILRNELDWIVMKALEKDRARRYETANGFAADINRYLAGDPVNAHPPSAGYRLKKFLRKHNGPVIAVCLLFLALVAGIVGTSLGLREAQRQEAIARDEAFAKDKARREAEAKEAEANAVVDFFQDTVFAAGRPKGEDGGLGHDVSLRYAILASLPVLATSFRDQPLVEARLRSTLGTTFEYLGENAKAAEQAELVRALACRHLGADHVATIASTENLATAYRELQRYGEALKLREEALAAKKRVLPLDHPDTLSSMNSLASSYADLNRHAEAIELYNAAIAGQKRVLPPEHPDLLNSMDNLATSYAALTRHAEAIKLVKENLAARKRVLPTDHPAVLRTMNSLANRYAEMNNHAEAIKLLEETLPARKRVLPPDHPSTIGAMVNLARSYREIGRMTDAVNILEEALPVMKAKMPDHQFTFNCMKNLACNYADLNRHAEAIKLLEELLPAQKRVLPPEHPKTLGTMYILAGCFAALNRHAEAIRLYEMTLDAQ